MTTHVYVRVEHFGTKCAGESKERSWAAKFQRCFHVHFFLLFSIRKNVEKIIRLFLGELNSSSLFCVRRCRGSRQVSPSAAVLLDMPNKSFTKRKCCTAARASISFILLAISKLFDSILRWSRMRLQMFEQIILCP